MPSASFSVAIASSFIIQRKVFSSTETFGSGLRLSGELALQLAFILGQFIEQVRADGQAVAAGKGFDFSGAAEGGAHDDRLDVVRLVVVVDFTDGDDARIFLRRVVLAGRLLVPVEDAADEGRDQEHFGVGAGDRLGLAEEKRQVAVDAFLLQHFRSTDAFPGGSELDQDAVWPMPRSL